MKSVWIKFTCVVIGFLMFQPAGRPVCCPTGLQATKRVKAPRMNNSSGEVNWIVYKQRFNGVKSHLQPSIDIPGLCVYVDTHILSILNERSVNGNEEEMKTYNHTQKYLQ